MTPLIQGFCDKRVPYFPVYYPKVGEFFIMDVVNLREQYSWHKDDKQLVLQNCSSRRDPNCTQPMYLVRNRTDLNFKNIALKDSGTYILEVLCPEKRVSSFKVIVQDKPIVVSDCKDMTVKEGGNITCVCKTTNGYPSAEVTWIRSKPYQENIGLKNSMGILRLENISKNQSGTYSCFANSHDFANKTSFNLEVVSNIFPPISAQERVKIEYFDVFQNAGIRNFKLTMICKANGLPEPTYTILHNGIPVAYGERHIIDKRNKSNLGQYECAANNSIGSDKRSVFLIDPFLDEEKMKVITPVRMNCKIVLIAGASSFTIGILFTSILICCFKKFIKDKNSDNSTYDDVSPHNAQVRLELNRVIHEEMRLRHISTSPGNDAVHHRGGASPDYINVGNTTGHVHCYDNEAGYQELSGFRETDDGRYESLNDVKI